MFVSKSKYENEVLRNKELSARNDRLHEINEELQSKVESQRNAWNQGYRAGINFLHKERSRSKGQGPRTAVGSVNGPMGGVSTKPN